MGVFKHTMNKIILICGFLGLNGCVSTEPDWYPPERDWHTPLYCPTGQVEYCEGRSPETLECRCMDRQDIRRIYEQIMIRNIA